MLLRWFTVACPWCGCRNGAPVAVPLRALEAALEACCRRCRGGIRGRARWLAFGSFALGVGVLANLTLALGMEGRLAAAGGAATGMWLGACAVMCVGLAAFLIANTEVRRGREPVPQRVD